MRFNFRNEADRWACINALRTAYHQYQEHEEQFRKIAAQYEQERGYIRMTENGAEMITKGGAIDLADQFKRQAEDVERIIQEIIDDEDHS